METKRTTVPELSDLFNLDCSKLISKLVSISNQVCTLSNHRVHDSVMNIQYALSLCNLLISYQIMSGPLFVIWISKSRKEQNIEGLLSTVVVTPVSHITAHYF
jgi:hypothetical protein